MSIQGNKSGTQMRESLSTKLNRLSQTANLKPAFQFQNIAHLVTEEMLLWSYRELRKDAASGIDGVKSKDYEVNLEMNIRDLHTRLKDGRYRAQPLRRIYIEKEDGKKRPLSIPTLEEKVAQKAATELLSRIYENDFLDCSYGYRPKKNAQDALNNIQRDIAIGNVNYVVDADIQDYFGSIVRNQLMEIIKKRITDTHLLRLIGKWLKVCALDEGKLLLSDDGIYQGSVISPILANIYLHEVYDLWVKRDVQPRLRGKVTTYRFADDLIACFEFKDDAERFLQVLKKRFERYGLKLHPDKTKLLEFGRSAWRKSHQGGPKSPTFNFLGFTHICGTSRNGKMVVKVKTMSKRLARGLKRMADWCQENRHIPLPKQHSHLKAVLQGHYQYYGRRGNIYSLRVFNWKTEEIWKKWLNRRTRGQTLSFEKFGKMLKKYPLPPPKITQRFTGFQMNLNMI
jgi:RNA-directed DNA polymerase